MRFPALLVVLLGFVNLGKSQRQIRNADYASMELSKHEVVIKLKHPDQATGIQFESLSASETNKGSALWGIRKATIPRGSNPIAYCNQLLKDENVLYAEPVVTYQLLETSQDPLSSAQYYLQNIKAQEAWNISRGDDDITIAIIDSGIDLDHPDLISKIWTNALEIPDDGIDNDQNGYIDDYFGYDFADDDPNPDADFDNHGSIVAGIAGAQTNNSEGISGIGYNTKIAALKGFRSEDGISEDLYEAIIYAADNDIQVANLSWGAMRTPSQYEQDVINYAVLEKNMVIIAAAGNEGQRSTREEKFYPASYDNVLSVAATNETDTKWSGSSFNYDVDITAPGQGIVSTTSDGDYNNSGSSGTSFAAPMVASAGALLKDEYPNFSAIQIMERLRVSSDDIYGISDNSQYQFKLGKGRLNIEKALQAGNLRSIIPADFSFSNQFGNTPSYGDSLNLTITFENVLAGVESATLQVFSDDQAIQFSGQEIELGQFLPNSQKTIELDALLSEQLPPETELDFRLELEDNKGYSDFHHLSFSLAPDFFLVGTDFFKLTAAGNGNLGFADASFSIGEGLNFQQEQLLKHAGLILAINENMVYDNVINDYDLETRSQDFQVVQPIKQYRHPAVDYFAYSQFEAAPSKLLIEQSFFSKEANPVIVFKYRISNTGTQDLGSLKMGFFSDWDLDEKTQNFASVDANGDYAVTATQEGTLYGGIKLAYQGTSQPTVINLFATNEVQSDLPDGFEDDAKYNLLLEAAKQQAGGTSGANVAVLHKADLPLSAGESSTFFVVMTAAYTLEELEDQLEIANEMIRQAEENPTILQVVSTCDGSEIQLNPEPENDFRFYRDPKGEVLLAEAESFQLQNILRDTAIYVSKRHEGYFGDIQQIKIEILDQIADFSLSADTLYLDQQSVIVFEDRSRNAVAWEWDFGQGTKSKLQDPRVSFNEAGVYTIKLTVMNNLGCSDAITKQLVVAKRPSTPTFSRFSICEMDEIELTSNTADKLRLYLSQEANEPILQGVVLSLSGFLEDTSVYVSAIIDGFESNRAEVSIDVFTIHEEIVVQPDTLSIAPGLVISRTGSDEIVEWKINGTSYGAGNSISILLDGEVLDIALTVENDQNCQKTIGRRFKPSTSPIPEANDLVFCTGEHAILRPANGQSFGFYRNANLSDLLTKGRQIIVDQTETLYVVGLDDGLPGEAITVELRAIDYTVQINYEFRSVDENQLIDLSAVSEDSIQSLSWSINGERVSSLINTTILLEDATNEIILRAISPEGCTTSDTLLLDLRLSPLNLENTQSRISIFPNPADHLLNIQGYSDPTVTIKVFQLDGKMAIEEKVTNNRLDISDLKKGTYILVVKSNLIEERLIFVKD
ncbi:MAG: S8 family serine peptidase [Bacteroidota bacterium]